LESSLNKAVADPVAIILEAAIKKRAAVAVFHRNVSLFCAEDAVFPIASKSACSCSSNLFLKSLTDSESCDTGNDLNRSLRDVLVIEGGSSEKEICSVGCAARVEGRIKERFEELLLSASSKRKLDMLVAGDTEMAAMVSHGAAVERGRFIMDW
jgi:hypothetical protein